MVLRLRLALDIDTATKQASVVIVPNDEPALPPWYDFAMEEGLLNPPPNRHVCLRRGCTNPRRREGSWFCSMACHIALRTPIQRIQRELARLERLVPHLVSQEDTPCLS